MTVFSETGVAPERIVQWDAPAHERNHVMRMKTTLSLGTFVIVALLVTGVSYRLIHDEPKLASPKSRPEVATSPNPGQAARENPGQEKPAPTSPAPATSPPSPAAGSSQPAKPPAPPSAAARTPEPPSTAARTPEPPPTAARAPRMPTEDRMSAANRRNVQEALHHRGYYQGPMDGIFGPRTRAAIRRFQDSIGAKSTGYLTALEANRLVSTS
jgi:hypothetical protein